MLLEFLFDQVVDTQISNIRLLKLIDNIYLHELITKANIILGWGQHSVNKGWPNI